MDKLDIVNNVTERIIIEISERSFSAKLSKDLGVTYSHTTKILNLLEENKIIQKINNGRTTHINLTKKGLLIQEKLREIRLLI